MFLIRDWASPLSFPFGLKGGTEYLKTELDTRSSDTAPKEIRDTARQLMSTFGRVSCFLMPHPGRAVATGAFEGDLTCKFCKLFLLFL